MARDGNGTYSLPAGNPVVTGSVISSTTHNNSMSDLASEMTNSTDKDGQTVITGAWDFNANQIILDADADTSITADTDDIIDIEVEGVDAIKIGWQSVADTGFLTLDPKAFTADATENTSRVHIGSTNAITIPTGTTARAGGFNIEEPNLTATGTITTAYTVRIGGAPTEGGTNNYSLWVDAGAVQFDETLNIDGFMTHAGYVSTVKVSDTSRNTTTTFADDDELANMSLAAGTYILEANLIPFSTSATPDFKYRLDLASGSVSFSQRIDWEADDSAAFLGVDVGAYNGTNIVQLAASTDVGAFIKGVITISVAAVLNLQWAQNTSDGTNVTLKSGSYVKFTKV